MVAKHHDHYEIAQMHHLTFWESFDHRHGTVVIQGYEVHYKENYEGTEQKYTRLRSKGTGSELIQKTFHFEDDEYIVHMGAAYGGSLDRVEFVTNKERHFVCGGPGGKYYPLTFDCSDGSHQRVIAFGFGLGPFDGH